MNLRLVAGRAVAWLRRRVAGPVAEDDDFDENAEATRRRLTAVEARLQSINARVDVMGRR